MGQDLLIDIAQLQPLPTASSAQDRDDCLALSTIEHVAWIVESPGDSDLSIEMASQEDACLQMAVGTSLLRHPISLGWPNED